MPAQHHRAAKRARWVALLAVALLWSQAVGLLHRAAHAPQSAHAAAVAPASPSVLDALFGTHVDGSQACQLFDHLANGEALTSASAAPTEAPPAPPLPHRAQSPRRVATAAASLARAPPPHG